MNPHIKSVLEPIIKDVYQAKTLEEGQTVMKKLVDSTKIKDEDKKKMLREINSCPTLVKLQFYATNALFKFEGLGVGEFSGSKK